MKKRITRLLLAAVMVFSLSLSLCTGAYADGAIGTLRDIDDIFSDAQEAELSQLIDEAATKTGYNIAVVVADDIGVKTPREYASDQLDTMFGEYSDSILLLICNDFDASECYDWIDMTGKAAEEYYDELNDIYDCIYSGLDVSGYYSSVVNFCEYFGADVSSSAGDVSSVGYNINLVDHDDVLTASEETQLREAMQLCADDITCNVGVIITDDLIGMSDYEYAKFFAENSFGVGANSIVLLYNNDRTNMNYVDWIYTYGLATDMYDYRIDDVFDYMYRGFDSDGGDNYYQGIMYFCSYLRNHKDVGGYNDYYEDDNYYYDDDGGYDIMSGVIIPVGFAAIVTFIVVSVTTSGYKKKKPVSAKSYMDASRTKYLRRDDIYLRETTTHVRISSSSSGGGGGSRGGGGGRSRSGGGGGGGRRR